MGTGQWTDKTGAGRLRTDSLLEALERATHSDSRLVLLVGDDPPGLRQAGDAAATELAWPLLDLNVSLAERLLPHTPSERREEAWDALDEIVGRPQPGVIIVGTDILFEPALGYRPYEALRRLGRRGPLVATWHGHVDGTDIIRAAPGHPEYTRVKLDVPYIAIEAGGTR